MHCTSVRTVPFVVTAILFSLNCLGTETVGKGPSDLNTELNNAIKKGIQLLEAKDHVAFLKSYVVPKELASILKKMGSIDMLAKQWPQDKAARLLKILKQIDGKTPLYLDGEMKRAQFDLRRSVDGKDSITFVRING